MNTEEERQKINHGFSQIARIKTKARQPRILRMNGKGSFVLFISALEAHVLAELWRRLKAARELCNEPTESAATSPAKIFHPCRDGVVRLG